MERLAIVARRTLRGVGQGQRRSKRHGGAVEFSDYRRYAPGDDTRRIDWHAYARLEQMFLKLYVEEQDLSVHVLLDQSASMGTGEPAKLPFARQLAIALAYLALATSYHRAPLVSLAFAFEKGFFAVRWVWWVSVHHGVVLASDPATMVFYLYGAADFAFGTFFLWVWWRYRLTPPGQQARLA